ncbi:MAG: hypothetical protein ABEH56_01935 [Salinirussus sp.]
MAIRSWLDTRTGGLAVVVGYLLLLVVSVLGPGGGLPAVTDSLQGIVYFVVLPVAGIGVGAYAVAGGSFGAAGLFVVASYLGIVGVGLSLGGFGVLAVALVGVVQLALAVVAVLGSLGALWSSLRVGTETGS